MKISVLTPTIRKAGLDLVRKALKNQSFTDYEWLIGSKFDPEIPEAKWVKDEFEGGYWTINRIYNKLVKEAKGELLISWQDYTYSKYDTLDRFWFHYQEEPKAIVTCVGHKYTQVLPELGAVIWRDPREKPPEHANYYQCNYIDIEYNLSAIPKAAIYSIGGFDEALDFMGYGHGFSEMERLAILKEYVFKIDQSIKSYSLVHDRPKDWDEHNFVNPDRSWKDFWLKHSAKYLDNPKLNYLDGGEEYGEKGSIDSTKS